jgi:pteridine reductase
MNVVVHYRRSGAQADALCSELNARRPGTASCIEADLLVTRDLPMLVDRVIARYGALDALVNNASTFYPTPLGTVTEAHWDDLMGSNLKGPFFLSQAAAPSLTARRGAIVNIVDIYAERPLDDHPVYSAAKAGLAMLTRALARELGPAVRVNGVAPGAILWPEQEQNPADRTEILARTALGRTGGPEDIARTVRFLLADAPYITGQILAVDGGRSTCI